MLDWEGEQLNCVICLIFSYLLCHMTQTSSNNYLDACERLG